MKTKEDQIWENLLAKSAPAFAGETEPPYGFVTRALANLRVENAEREQIEKVGKWAIWTSLAALVGVIAISMNLQLKDRGDLDPGLRSFAQVENLQID